ncbi:hypothetical protein CC85DRAFT_24592 [Cutaneotrichosporon oleaginosum]|uniref:Uncharacterized protein n=1 Tax=Cutaneotrichosporon oleaginosum TaxID=879819 RepID=A0A0J1B8X6_9TREE|nr:uncharacterized protein CC85DRAFT_24592 [Cutaneotrichosporon oleaginosum]KLT44249.1 hypothetical protein CC85DRAFT_24592 [Cutaneotrichosporon oleaginosum]TXT11583.1 hypothetical protein COLE_01993 [Cutaneotrichosporon oleaginosum]
MNPAFVNIERPLSEGGLGTGKGGYWKVSEDTKMSHRGRGKKPRLESPADSRSARDLRSPTCFPTSNAPQMQTYPPRPLVHPQTSFNPYPTYAHPSHTAFAPPSHHPGGPIPYPIRAAPAFPDPCERDRSTAYPSLSASGNHNVLLSPALSLPDSAARRPTTPTPTRRTSSLDVSPGRSTLPRSSQPQPQPRPVHAVYPRVSPPALVRSSYYATQSPPDCRIATPSCDGLSSLMQLANAAETDHAKARPHVAPQFPAAPHAPVPHRLPNVNALLNGTPVGSSECSSSPRLIYG